MTTSSFAVGNRAAVQMYPRKSNCLCHQPRPLAPEKPFRTHVLSNGDIHIIPVPPKKLMDANDLHTAIEQWPLVCIPGVVDPPVVTAGRSELASKVRFRIPEKIIRIDFCSKVGADDASKVGEILKRVASELADRTSSRLRVAEDGATSMGEATSRHTPLDRRDTPLSRLDTLADIASTRHARHAPAVKETPGLLQPLQTQQWMTTALRIDLDSIDVPESSLRSSLNIVESSSATSSPLSILSDSESDAEVDTMAQMAALREMTTLFKRVSASQPANPVSWSKRKAAVAANLAITGSRQRSTKKLQSASSAVDVAPLQVRSPAASATGAEEILLTGNQVARSGRAEDEGISEARASLLTAYNLAGRYTRESKEIEQLRVIGELMRLKGPDRLLHFMLSPNEPAGAAASSDAS